MSEFLLTVQVGLLAWCSMHKRFDYTGRRKRENQAVFAARAMNDAVVYEEHFKHKHGNRSGQLTIEDAAMFIRWATEGTQYDTITHVLGKRDTRPY